LDAVAVDTGFPERAPLLLPLQCAASGWEVVVAEIWTVSEWLIGDLDPATFVAAFQRFANGATASGRAHEGMILQNAEDPQHFVVVRRWASQEAVDDWGKEQHQHSGELRSLGVESRSAGIMTKLADLGAGGTDTA
jgi:hypothetical protein